MNKFYFLIFKWLYKRVNIPWCENCLESKHQEIYFDFLLSHSSRKTRRKWYRMMTRCNSPFYIGKVVKEK